MKEKGGKTATNTFKSRKTVTIMCETSLTFKSGSQSVIPTCKKAKKLKRQERKNPPQSSPIYNLFDANCWNILYTSPAVSTFTDKQELEGSRR